MKDEHWNMEIFHSSVTDNILVRLLSFMLQEIKGLEFETTHF